MRIKCEQLMKISKKRANETGIYLLVVYLKTVALRLGVQDVHCTFISKFQSLINHNLVEMLVK